MAKTAALISVLLFSSFVLSACRTDRSAVMGLTNAQIEMPAKATEAK